MGGAVLRAVPGYVLPTDLAGAALYVKPPAGATVVGAHADAPRAPSTADAHGVGRAVGGRRLRASGPHGGGLRQEPRRRAFSDGSTAVAHYNILPPFASQVAALGTHLADVAWLPREYPTRSGARRR